jgi:hypothetical protein
VKCGVFFWSFRFHLFLDLEYLDNPVTMAPPKKGDQPKKKATVDDKVSFVQPEWIPS